MTLVVGVNLLAFLILQIDASLLVSYYGFFQSLCYIRNFVSFRMDFS